TNVANSTMERVTVTGGFPPNGAYGCGIGAWKCTGLVLSECAIVSNVFNVAADNAMRGGGLYAETSTLTLSNCVVSRNVLNITGNYGGASLSGAGLYLSGGSMTVIDSTIFGNALIQTRNIPSGGGVTVNGGLCRLRNCLVQGNSSYRGPGTGLYLSGASTTILENCTVAYNIGQGIARSAGTVIATNSIIWGNVVDVTGAVSLASCDIQTADATWTNGVNGCFSSDPLFEYGYYLAEGSPCRGAGTNSSAYWGLTNVTTRVGGAPDAGASVDLGYHYRTGFDLSYADLYVAPGPAGSDGNAGTNPALPLTTIGKAMARARDGTRIHVGSGTYTTNTEAFPLSMSCMNGVALLGTNPLTTVINARGSGKQVMTLDRCDGLRLEKLTFTGGKPVTRPIYGCGLSMTDCGGVSVSDCSISSNEYLTAGDATIWGGGLYISSSSVTVSNCLVSQNRLIILGNYGASLLGGGLHLDVGGLLVIRESVISSNKCNAQSGREGAGVYVGGGACLVRNCLVAGNSNPGDTASAGVSGKGSGLYLNGAGASMTIESCTVANNASQGIGQASGMLTVTNTILWGNGDDLTGAVAVAFSDIQTADSFWTNGTRGCISANPLFANASAGDFHLSKVSPCVNAGLNQSWMSGSPDLGGGKRVLSGTVDMGAYESLLLPGFVMQIR
ncbi:MAG: right-handed parallel beta-helix repeat-containing protein, partial [bacterium]